MSSHFRMNDSGTKCEIAIYWYTDLEPMIHFGYMKPSEVSRDLIILCQYHVTCNSMKIICSTIMGYKRLEKESGTCIFIVKLGSKILAIFIKLLLKNTQFLHIINLYLFIVSTLLCIKPLLDWGSLGQPKSLFYCNLSLHMQYI